MSHTVPVDGSAMRVAIAYIIYRNPLLPEGCICPAAFAGLAGGKVQWLCPSVKLKDCDVVLKFVEIAVRVHFKQLFIAREFHPSM